MGPYEQHEHLWSEEQQDPCFLMTNEAYPPLLREERVREQASGVSIRYLFWSICLFMYLAAARENKYENH